MDVEALEQELDTIIEKRAREARDANAVEELWAVTEREVCEKRRQENREAWLAHHELIRKLHQGLAREHSEKAAALLEGGS